MMPKNIIVAGDSWSMGEWSTRCDGLHHGGISQYLSDHGFNVINLGIAGGSNRETMLAVTNFFRNNLHIKKSDTLIIIFQTEWTRDFPYMIAEDEEFLCDPTTLKDRLISRFYYDLSAVSKEFDIGIKILGGASDALSIDDFVDTYPGVEIICQSVTNLLITGNSQIDDPVFSTFTAPSESAIQEIRKHIVDNETMASLIEQIEKGHERCQLWSDNPLMFFPDGSHPNREAHKVICDYVIRKIMPPEFDRDQKLYQS